MLDECDAKCKVRNAKGKRQSAKCHAKRENFHLPFTIYNSPKPAFTLSEVLITLGIIGVVAAMTIPTLINSYQKTQTVAQLKKAYSTVSQTFQNAQNEIGESTGWDYPTTAGDSTASNDWWDKYFLPYMGVSVVKTCTGATVNQCWSSRSKWLDGVSFPPDTSFRYFILADGSSIGLIHVFDNLSFVLVDINGLKTPNIVGKDIFLMDIMYKKGYVELCQRGYTRSQLLGTGTYGCEKTLGTNKGQYCGALIQQDGWQIKNDYPW